MLAALVVLACGALVAYKVVSAGGAEPNTAQRPPGADPRTDPPTEDTISARIEEAWRLFHAGRQDQAEGSLEGLLMSLEENGSRADVTRVAEALDRVRMAADEQSELADAARPHEPEASYVPVGRLQVKPAPSTLILPAPSGRLPLPVPTGRPATPTPTPTPTPRPTQPPVAMPFPGAGSPSLGGGGAQPGGASPMGVGGAPAPRRSSNLDEAYQTRRAKLEDADASGFVKLARWARKKKLFEEEKDALRLALRANPDHARAKGKLEDIRDQEKAHSNWRTPWRKEASVVFVETNTTEARLWDYCDSVSAFYNGFRKVFNVRIDPLKTWGKKIGVKIFATRRDFERYQAETGAGAGESAVGYYSRVERELVLYYDAANPEETLDTLFHEGTHLFVNLALGDDVELPIWLSEGIAEYFAPARYDREQDELVFGRPQFARLEHAKFLIEEEPISLRGTLLRHTDYPSFGVARYALSWSLVHMLIEKRKQGSDKPKYRKRFVHYFNAVAEGADPVASFEQTFGNLAELEEEWFAYVRSLELPKIEAARVQLEKGNLAEAVEILEEHTAANPTDPAGFFEQGYAYFAMGDFARAAEALEKTVELDPDYEEAWLTLALAYAASGQATSALKAAQEAVRISPNELNYFALSVIAMEAGHRDVALSAIKEAIRQGGPQQLYLFLEQELEAMPEGPPPPVGVPTRTEDPPEDAAPRPEPSQAAVAAFDRGAALHDQNDYDGAITAYTQSLRIQPDFSDAYYNRGRAKHEQGDLLGAIADYTETIRLEPRHATAYYNRGRARKSAGDHDKAIEDFGEAIRYRASYPKAYYERAHSKQELGDHDGAIADYTLTIQMQNNHAKAYYGRATARQKTDDVDGCIADWTQVIRITPDDASAYANRGHAKVTKGDLKGAAEDFEQALERNPDDGDARRALAKVRRKLR